MAMQMNGLRTEYCEHRAKKRNGDEYVCGKTIFVALPKEAWRKIEGGCGCDFCKSHPELEPQWDTLVVDATGKSRYTTTCHYPELQH